METRSAIFAFLFYFGGMRQLVKRYVCVRALEVETVQVLLFERLLEFKFVNDDMFYSDISRLNICIK